MCEGHSSSFMCSIEAWPRRVGIDSKRSMRHSSMIITLLPGPRSLGAEYRIQLVGRTETSLAYEIWDSIGHET